MLKRMHFLLAAFSVILAACSGLSTTAAPTSTSTLPVDTATPEATTVAVADCTAVSFVPTPDPTISSIFPEPGAEDWVLGPDTASVTILEYSDFQ